MPAVVDVPRRGQEAVLTDPDLLVVLQWQGHDLTCVVVGQRNVPGAAAFHHDQRHPGNLAVPRAAQWHIAQLGLEFGPQQHVVGEVDPVVLRQVELHHWDAGAGDLDV